MKSLVTGGAGFIGSRVANELLQMGHQVVVLDDLSGGFIENVNPECVFVKGSVLDDQLLKELFKTHKFDYVFHFAAYAAEGLSHFIKRFNYNNNLIGSVNLINESIKNKIKCFVFTSSIAVYGSAQLPMKEDMYPLPEDSYGIAKYAVEQELKVSHEMFGLNYIIFRPHNVFGENQNIGDRYRNVIGIFMNQLLQNMPITIFGDGLQQRAFTYIGDIAPTIAKSVMFQDAYQEVFNIGADQYCSVKELAEIVMKVMEIKGKINFLPARNEVKIAYSDHSKVTGFFGNQSKTPLETGIIKMAEWVKKVGVRKTPVFKDIEIMQNLPDIWTIE